MTDQEKHEYLIEWGWKTSTHEQGFLVYRHVRFPNVGYKQERAYERMKAAEPSSEPILVARLDNPEEMKLLKDFTDRLINPPTQEERLNELLTRLVKSV